MWLLETRNLGQCVWKPMTVCLPAFVECVRVARQRRKWARAKCWIIEELEGGRRIRLRRKRHVLGENHKNPSYFSIKKPELFDKHA